MLGERLRQARSRRSGERRHRQPRPARTDASSSRSRSTDKIFTVLVGVRRPGLRHARPHARPAAQRDPGARPRGRQLDHLGAADFDTRLLRRPVQRRRRVDEGLLRGPVGGRYSVDVTTEDWVTVPGNASTYGDNAVEDFGGSWAFVDDTVDAWYAAQVAAGKTAQRDRRRTSRSSTCWDRYDFDADGDFNEPDGYIDHFQAVHAGEGEEAGGGARTPSGRTAGTSTATSTASPARRRRREQPRRRRADRRARSTSDRRLHRRARERRPRRLRPRVRPRPRPPGLLRHRRRRERHGVLDADVLRLVARPRRRPRATASAPRPACMGPEEKLFLGWLDYTEVDAGEAGTFTLSPSQLTRRARTRRSRSTCPTPAPPRRTSRRRPARTPGGPAAATT